MRQSYILACVLASAVGALAAPAAASASSSQLSSFQEDRELLGFTRTDPAQAMAELRALGVDVIRTNVIYYKVYRSPSQGSKPAGFRASDPESSQYDFSRTDRLVALARENGMRVLMTVTGPGPRFTSSSPGRCRRVPCTFRPKAGDFGQFVEAVAKRYRGKVDYYSLYNEPNLDVWITPQQRKPAVGRVQTEGAIYRKLWIAGYKAIAKSDPGRRNRVLFGETAAIGEPLPLLQAALCLDVEGRPFTGAQRGAHGCSGRPAKLNIGGFAIHPYNFGGFGTPRTKTKSESALPIAYMPRLHRLIDNAYRRGRIRRRAPIFVTEFGFQSNPPDRVSKVSPAQQGQYINESDRLLFGDSRVAMTAQYELSDPPEQDQFNSGLRFTERGGRQRKPAYDAYRLPLVVTRRSSGAVEVYGQARPTRLSGGSTSVAVQVSEGGGEFATVAQRRTNARGIFQTNISRAGAAGARWRLSWLDPVTGQPVTSRIAKAGKRLRYYPG